MIIAVDFDGTITKESKWPELGEPNLPFINELIRRRKNGDKLILWTCRNGDLLQAAINFCKAFGLEFDAVNDHLPELKERFGNDTRKVYADLYVDDKAVKTLVNEEKPKKQKQVYIGPIDQATVSRSRRRR